MTILSPQQRARMVDQYAAGVPVAQIAKTFGVNKAYPGLAAKLAGVPLRTSKVSRSLMARAAKWRHGRDAR